MAELLGAVTSQFSGTGSQLHSTLTFIGWSIVICIPLAFIAIIIVNRITSKDVIEFNISNKIISRYTARDKKKRGLLRSFWSRKFGRFIPLIHDEYRYHTKKGRQVVPIVKDKNGLYHLIKIPNYEEMAKYYKEKYNIDINLKEGVDELRRKQEEEGMVGIYCNPSPHETLDWLAGQVVEANEEFKYNHWWQSPTVMVIGTAFICLMMIVLTEIFRNKTA